jgi:transglutaminase-like putative cysteine protease
MSQPNLQPFLRSTRVVDWQNPEVYAAARALAGEGPDPRQIARRCFEYVRDQIAHSWDHGHETVTRTAPEVLAHRTGFCYAKSHLLAALLRANEIACGFVYQRLRCGPPSEGYCLHGLNALWLADLGWYRVDARGRAPHAAVAEFSPPDERLAFAVTASGELLFDGVWAEPVAPVLDALSGCQQACALAQSLPDATALGEPDARI